MKKCKVTIALNAGPKHFYLAPDAETLYLLTTKTIEDNKGKKHKELLQFHPDIEVVTLEHNEYAEIEWAGCQNFHDEGIETIRTNLVRLAKASKLTSKNSHNCISVHFGWILNDQLRFTNHRKSGVRVKMLEKKDKQMDFNELFQDEETMEEMMSKAEVISVC